MATHSPTNGTIPSASSAVRPADKLPTAGLPLKEAFRIALAAVILLAAAGAEGPEASAPSQAGIAGLPLDGKWEFRRAGEDSWKNASVPGCVHLDLLAAGLIPDPFDRDNENSVQWVAEEDWEYRRVFDLPASLFIREHVELICQGLDTFAKLTVNGRYAGATDNMFRRWRLDIKPLLRPGANEILVRFESPMKAERRLEKRLSYKLPGEAPHVRKAPYHFGWDWGPRLATSGIWRSIGLEAWDSVRIAGLQIIQDGLSPSLAEIRVRAEIHSSAELAAEAEVVLEGNNGSRRRLPVHLVAGPNAVDIPMKIKRPALWWPAGMGGQDLYTARLTLRRGGAVLDASELRTGLRTLTLEQTPDAWGTSFRFAVNGVPFFAKGGNWIPADSFPSRVTRDKYERLLRDCAEANMNMVRVWGGGIYESPDFYSLCDELGLVVWQDFMFACALYPGDEDFLKNVAAEAEDVVRVLRHHPSLALWCGNNECEEGWFHWGWKESLPAKVWEDYERIFHELLPGIVGRLDPGRAYWPSSPHSLRPGDPRAEDSGDMHVWDVWHGREPFEAYRLKGHRFLSEFGFQSFPLLETVKSFARPEDWNLTSPVMEHHQKNARGNGLIMHYLLDRYRMPRDFESLLWLSQVLQAEGMKIAVEHFRSRRPRTMGALYWQLNDCWPVASWSGMDYFGRWKALHYYARRFFNPILAASIPVENQLKIHAVSDLLRPLEAELRWTLAAYGGGDIARGVERVRLDPGSSRVVLSKTLEEWLSGMQERDVYLHCALVENGRTWSSNIHHFVPLKAADLPDPGLLWSVAAVEGRPAVTVSAARLAKDVHLEASGLEGRFEDNFFDLLPGESRTVVFRSPRPPSPGTLESALIVRSLRDTYVPAR